MRPFQEFLIVLAFLETALLCTVYTASAYLPRDNLDLRFLDVGQGDASLIRGPAGTTILIDSGPDNTVLAELGTVLPFFEREIDLVILTHPDLDHSGGMVEVLRRFKVGAFLTSLVSSTTNTYDAILTELSTQDIPIMFAEANQDLLIDGALLIDIISPLSTEESFTEPKTNNASVVTRLIFGEITALFTGDIESPVEKRLVERDSSRESAARSHLASDILKVPHHGSKTSSTIDFLNAVHPRFAVISVGKDNRYGHPSPEVMERYSLLGSEMHLTARDGALHLQCSAEHCKKAP